MSCSSAGCQEGALRGGELRGPFQILQLGGAVGAVLRHRARCAPLAPRKCRPSLTLTHLHQPVNVYLRPSDHQGGPASCRSAFCCRAAPGGAAASAGSLLLHLLLHSRPGGGLSFVHSAGHADAHACSPCLTWSVPAVLRWWQLLLLLLLRQTTCVRACRHAWACMCMLDEEGGRAHVRGARMQARPLRSLSPLQQ